MQSQNFTKNSDSISLIRWFAKRFLHPDIVAEYNYIFLWDEDLGVENFHPERYANLYHSHFITRSLFHFYA